MLYFDLIFLGFDTRVTTEELNTGARLNEIIKRGAIDSSEAARRHLRYYFEL